MAINFLDAITVNSGAGNASTIIASGTRPVTITGGAIGSVAIGGSAGGWSTGYFFKGSSGTNRGGFGALGNVDTVSYYWIGDAYNDTTMVIKPNAGNVGIGTTSPTEKLHVKTSGVEVAKYETTATADLAIELANSQGSMFFGLGGGEQFGVGTTSDLNGTGNLFIIEQGGNVGIGTTSPNDGDLTIGAPRLHVAVGGTSGTFNLAARFQSTTSDADNTGTSILINSSNDRGLLIKAGRKDGDREVAYFDVVTSVGNTTNMLTMGKFDSDYNVGIGTTTPTEKLEVSGNAKATSVRATGGADGGFVLRQWTYSSNYASLATNGMSSLEYCMISDGTNTLIGAGTGGVLKLRGPANDSSPQIVINGSSVTVDNGSTVGGGAVRAKYKSSDNSSGITTTVGVRNSNNSASLTLTIKDGIITGVSSDRRLKTNITLIGTSESGINIYTFEYKYKFGIEGVGLFQGVMSDEVPDDAVTVDIHGFDVVDYSLIDVEFKRISI